MTDYASVVEKDMGITNYEKIKEFAAKVRESPTLEKRYYRPLHPNKIDNTEFWKYLAEREDYNPYCGDGNVDNRMTGFWNYGLALTTGIYNYLDWLIYMKSITTNGEQKPVILEIGTGTGWLRDTVEGKVDYTGIDVYTELEGVIQTDGFGIPNTVENNSVDLVVSTNVFQHLSSKQRNHYYRDVHRVLKVGGCFSFNMQTVRNGGVMSVVVCGQCLQIPSVESIMGKLKQYFHIINIGSRDDGWCTFHCRKEDS